MKSKKNIPSQVNNADDERESQKSRKDCAGITSDKSILSQSYCLYYPIEMNSVCKYCNEQINITSAKAESHLKSHAVETFEYKCGVCEKDWPSWRSVMTHFNKSNCRHNRSTIIDSQTQSTNKCNDDKSKEVIAYNEQEKEEKKVFYCNLCASGGWSKAVSLSQHMRHMHPSEYNATIEVPMVKKRWTRDEVQILAQLEARIPSDAGLSINQILAEKFPSRTYEAIKSHRKRQDYRTLVEQIRLQGLNNVNQDTLNCTYINNLNPFSNTNSISVINKNNCFGDDHSMNNFDVSDVSQVTLPSRSQITTDETLNYPNIKLYLQDKVINSKTRLCEAMNNAAQHFVFDIHDTNPVDEALEGIYQAIMPNNNKELNKDNRPPVQNKRKSQKAKEKAQQYAHYQRLFKSDKSKLACEIFDKVDTSAIKPPIDDAYAHFRGVWERDAVDNATIDTVPTRGADILLGPITQEEIALAISQTSNDTAVGPDSISLQQIRPIAKRELWCAYNIWLGMRRIPENLRMHRTSLLPKGNEELENIKNWRPITIASLLIRIYNKILAKRMQLTFRISQKQTGFKPINGVGQNISLLHNLLKNARHNKSNLFVCLLDVSKAFDSVPHDSIKRALKRNGCPNEFIDLINDQYSNIYTRISYGPLHSKEIFLKRGVKQGDPMSSILFNLVMDELFEILGDRFGYNIDNIGSVNARAFADDLALFSSSEIGMKELLRQTEEFLLSRGLEINAKKCVAICLRKAGKAKKSQVADSHVQNPPVFIVNQEPIRLLGISDQCKYLGIQFTPLGAVDHKAIVANLRLALKTLSKAPLKPQQKTLMLRMYLIPRFIYSFIYTECYPKLMGQQDRLIKRWLKQTLRLPSSTTNEFFYIPIKEGGLGIGRLFDIIGLAKINLYNSMVNAGDLCLKFLIETQSYSMHTRWCQALNLSYRPSANEINTRKKIVLEEAHKKLSETVHGGGSEIFKASPLTNQWIAGHTKILSGRTFIKCIQMRTNTIPTRVTTTRGQNVNKRCRRCNLADETLVHILQTCPITHGIRCQRHNNICKKVAEKLREKGHQVSLEKSIPSPGSQTNISRPDLIAIRNNEALVLDVTCVYESNCNSLQDAYYRKVERYKNLTETIKTMFQVESVVYHGLCVGSRGSYDKKHISIWQSLGFSKEELMIIAIRVMEDSLRIIKLFNNANSLPI